MGRSILKSLNPHLSQEPANNEWAKSDIECAFCEDPIYFTDDVIRITVVQGHINNQDQIELFPILNEEGDYDYEPQHLHLSCMESILEDLDQLVENLPPVEHPEGIFVCVHTKGGGCKSDILAWEHFALLEIGEVQISRKTPDGAPTSIFVSSGEPNTLCLSCLHRINGEIVGLWSYQDDTLHDENPVAQDGECEECLHKRCWRNPTGCVCECHQEGEET